VYRANALSADIGGTSGSVILAIKELAHNTVSAKLEMKLEAKVVIKELFKLGGSSSVSFETQSSVTSSFEAVITAELELPEPPDPKMRKDAIHRLVVTPRWHVPEEKALIEPGKKPYWVPDAYVDKRIIPWCLTYQVTEVRRENQDESSS
jgi:hypothetical protein